MRRLILFAVAWLSLSLPSFAQESYVTLCQYWFDNDYNNPLSMDVEDGVAAMTVDASALTDGLHTLNYRVRDNLGAYSALHSWLFMKVVPHAAIDYSATSLSYWLDNDQAHLTTLPVSGSSISFTADATTLDDGLHQIKYYVADAQGNRSNLQTWLFMKAAPLDTLSHMATSLSYWLDNDQTHLTTLPVEGSSISFTADATTLDDGLHQIKYYVADAQGNRSNLQTWLFMKAALPDTIAHGVTALSYWMDDDRSHTTTVGVEGDNISFVADASSLTDGLHQIKYYLTDDQNRRSELYTWLFMKVAPRDTLSYMATSLSYWMDNDQAHTTTLPVEGDDITFTADASALEEGIHQIKYHVTDAQGNRSSLHTWLFMKAALPDTLAHGVTALSYWMDDDQEHTTTIGVESDSISFTADASSLPDGLHQLKYYLTDDQNRRSELYTWLFMKAAPIDTLVHHVTTLKYWLDDDREHATTLEVAGDSISFAADASELTDGMHTLSYYFTDDQGKGSMLYTWGFLKGSPTDGEKPLKIAWCEYWWNENTDKAVREIIDSDSATYVFERQLDVPEYAKTDGYSPNSVARFNIVFGDDEGGCSSLLYADVEYPDEIAPETVIEADTEEADGTVTLTWHVVNDQLEYYNVYYSENGKPFVLWLPNTTATNAVFDGRKGRSYRFAATATDKAGNRGVIKEENTVTVRFKP